MKLMKKSFSMLLAVAMVFTATFGCMTVSSFAADSGTGSEAAEMTGFSFENVDCQIINESEAENDVLTTIKLNVTFDKNIKVINEEKAKEELDIKIQGSAANARRNMAVSASDNVLNITYTATGGVPNMSGNLTAEAGNITSIVTADNDVPVKWDSFSTYVPIGITLKNENVNGSAESPASDKVTVTHKANMRGMYHFQLMSNGKSVLGETGNYYAGTMTSHAHNFNTSITRESIAQAMANAINNIEGYTAVYEEGKDTFTVTADAAKDGEELTVQMFEANADCRDQKAILAKAKADLDGVDNNTNPAISKAYEAYNAFMEKDDSSKKQMDYIKLINQMNEAPVEPAKIAEGTKVELDGGDNVSISLESVPAGWTSAVNGITVQQVGVENDVKTYTKEQAKLTIEEGGRGYSLSVNADLFRNESTTSGKKSAQFMITVTATGFKDCSTVVNVKNYGAEKFYIRYIDEKTGKVIKSKSYTMEQLQNFSKAKSGAMYQTYCSMAGLRNFCADGVLIEDLMKDAGISGKAGMTVKLRNNDSAAEESGNDSETDNAYHWMGTFKYEKLFSDRYYFPAAFTDKALKTQLSDENAKFVDNGDDSSKDVRTALGSSEGKIAVRPMIAWNYDEKTFKSDTSKPSIENYTDRIKNERAFRFLYGIGMESENVTANETTTWSARYCAFGVDIIDPDYKPESGSSSSGSSSTVTPATKYTVNKPAGSAEGKVSVSPSSAEKSDTVTITVTPADGYKTGTVTVTDKNGNKVSVSGSDNKYTFKMPASAVTVKVTYEKTAAAQQPIQPAQPTVLPFKDVKTDRWSYSAIKYAYENKLFSGTSANEFSPADEMTRGMLVTVLYRLAGEPAVNGDAGFADIKSGDWYAKAVAWAKANNIVSGVSAAEFAPNKDITREQMAAILHRYAAYKSYSTAANGSIAGFNDNANVSAFAKDAVSWAVGEKLISGTGNNTLAPKGNATREQVAAILQRFAENIAK